MIELIFIPITWILIIVDVLFTTHSLKETKKKLEKKLKKKNMKVEDLELNPLARFIIKKIGYDKFPYAMIPFALILITSLLLYGLYESETTYMMGVGFFFGAYAIIIRIHISNYLFLKKYKKR